MLRYRPAALRAVTFALFSLLLGLAPLAASAQERTMYWRALAVEARLDADGVLHVRERQAIVFDGPWNGGERVFDVRRGQRLRFERLLREAPGGQLVELTRGSLERVDRYDFTDSRTLRWRSRAPEDPPFAGAELTYVLEYSLSGVLVPAGERRYRLSHDFAFPDREWPIQSALAELELDPAWAPEGDGAPLVFEGGLLHAGESLVGAVDLRWVGAGTGPSPTTGLPWPLRPALAILLAGMLGGAVVAVVRHGRARGQLAPLPAPATVDEAFLREHVLSRPPEVVGAAWDDEIGPAEVAAVLARMTAEGKLTSRVERKGWGPFGRDVLHLALQADRDSLPSYERKLAGVLFVEGSTIDTDRLRAHYRKRGFDPASHIRSALRHRVRGLARRGEGPGLLPLLAAAALFAAGVVLGIRDAREGGDDAFWLVSVHAAVWPTVMVGILAHGLRRRAFAVMGRSLLLWALLAAWAGGVLWLACGGVGASALAVAAHAAVWTGAAVMAGTLARTSLSAEEIRLRQRLAAARDYLARELVSESPRLDDAWLPYLLAFGLGAGVDRWFRVHGERRSRSRSSGSGSAAEAGVGAGGTARWTGGGGSFSGGGAAGTWSALGGIASSIPAPSSGSGSGGGGGGGSSSGGGGGGGW